MHSAKLTVALGIIAIGLWFLFDKTLYGFLLAAVTAAIGTCFVSLLVKSGVYRCDFPGVGVGNVVAIDMYTACI